MKREHLDFTNNQENSKKEAEPTIYCDSLENVSNEEEEEKNQNLPTENSSKSLIA